MFCARCGRQIDENGKFCPFCGQEVGAPVRMAAPGEVSAGGDVPFGKGMPAGGSVSAGRAKFFKKMNRKWMCGIVAAAVLLIAAGTVIAAMKLTGTEQKGTDTAEEIPEEKSSDREPEQEETPGDRDADEDEATDAGQLAEEDEDTAEEEEQGEVEEEELLAVLSAYQAYVDELGDVGVVGYVLAYLDEDDIPELIVIGDCEAAGQMIITYRDGELTENYIGRLGGLSYVEKQNFYCNSNGHMGFYYDEFYRLEDGEQVVIASGQYGDKYDEEGNLVWDDEEEYPVQEYAWEGVSCSQEEYYEQMADFIQQEIGEADFTSVDTYRGELYFNMLDAYNGLKVKLYSAYWPQVAAFELEDDVLTFSVGGGARYGWGTEEILYSVSYPVAEDCIWENRSVGTGQQSRQPQVGDTEYLSDTTYEEIKEWIASEKSYFEEIAAAYGEDEALVESPVNVVVVVEDGVVVRVYTVIS